MPASLHFLTGALSGSEVPLPAGETRIGRNPDLELVLPLEDRRYVSRVHAVIRVEPERCTLEDRGSTNGTWVNGRRVERTELKDGDEIQFGRRGPVARFQGAPEHAETVVADDDPAAVAVAAPAAASPPPPSDGERPSQLVRRLVDEALARREAPPGRRPMILGMGALLFAGVGFAAVGGFALFGMPDRTEDTFRRMAAEYEDRVVLVETGILVQGEYIKLGNGSGFVADGDGFIVTNKHVTHSHRYSQSTACIAESLRRRGISYEDALVVAVWKGGTRFRQTPTSSAGDRGFGYSTDLGTLRIAGVAPDNVAGARTVQCSDFPFRGSGFTMTWRPHVNDNNDLAVLRASDPLPGIPLATEDVRADDPVMVFGFPSGVTPLETNDAEPIRRTGRVLRSQETIQIDAVVLHGNSGGPLLDLEGRVVGVTTRGPAETLNMAIKVEHVHRLLERARRDSPAGA